MNSFDNFSILFVGDSLHIGNRIFPMGAMATEILNWDRVPLRKLRTRAEEFDSAICAVLKSRDRELIHGLLPWHDPWSSSTPLPELRSLLSSD